MTWTWCLCLWSCLDILITMRFSINCSPVICSPTIIYAIMREATSETYGPRVYFTSYCISLNLIYYLAIFTFQSIQQKYQKYLLYYLYQISLLQVAVKGLTTPLSRWLQGSWLFVQVLGDLRVISYWIDTLVLQKLREILMLLCCITLSSSRENQRMLKR